MLHDAWGQYNKVHMLVVDPYRRVGILRPSHEDTWSASLTRAIINTTPEKVAHSSFNAIFKIDHDKYEVCKLWNATINETDYDLLVIELKPNVVFSVYSHMKLSFLPTATIVDEILDDKRLYDDDTICVMTHLAVYVDNKGIGPYKFKEVV